MGSVYRALDLESRTLVAIKLLDASEREALARFRGEAKAMALLHHPNIVSLLDHAIEGPKPYIVMELLEGTLADLVAREGPLPPERAIPLLSDLLLALSAAHDSGVVHRDVKPSNLLLTRDGRAKLSDFGIARRADQTLATRTGALLGTWSYMAPEQRADAKAAGPASDQFSAAATLYHALTGLRPQDLHLARPGDEQLGRLPAAIASVVARGAAWPPERRFPSAQAMQEALLAALGGIEPQAAPDLPETLAPGQDALTELRFERPRAAPADRRALLWLAAGLLTGALLLATPLSAALLLSLVAWRQAAPGAPAPMPRAIEAPAAQLAAPAEPPARDEVVEPAAPLPAPKAAPPREGAASVNPSPERQQPEPLDAVVFLNVRNGAASWRVDGEPLKAKERAVPAGRPLELTLTAPDGRVLHEEVQTLQPGQRFSYCFDLERGGACER